MRRNVRGVRCAGWGWGPAAQNWKTPVLITHGEQDYRCPIGEGLGLFEAFQYHAVPSELLAFPDENHWILKPLNSVAGMRPCWSFLRARCDGFSQATLSDSVNTRMVRTGDVLTRLACTKSSMQ